MSHMSVPWHHPAEGHKTVLPPVRDLWLTLLRHLHQDRFPGRHWETCCHSSQNRLNHTHTLRLSSLSFLLVSFFLTRWGKNGVCVMMCWVGWPIECLASKKLQRCIFLGTVTVIDVKLCVKVRVVKLFLAVCGWPWPCSGSQQSNNFRQTVYLLTCVIASTGSWISVSYTHLTLPTSSYV